MSDSWIGKSEEEIRKDVITISKEETGLTNFKSTGVLRGFLEVLISVLIAAYKNYINPISQQVCIDTATGTWLSFWGLLCGVTRKPATKTTGRLTGIAYDTGKIQAGTWIIVEGTDLRFKVYQEVSFTPGEFNIPVIAEFEGSEYNIAPGTNVRSTTVVPGLESIEPGEDWILSLGTAVESDNALRMRIKDKWKSIGEGNPPAKFEYIAATVPGVVEAKVIRTPRGYGSMDVIIAAENGLPSQILLDEVRQKLDDRSLVCRDLLVRGPEPKYIDIEIEFSGDVSETEIEITARQYVFGLGIGGKLEMRNFYIVPWEKFNNSSFEILEPIRDVTTEKNQMIIPQNITVTKV
ncbi:MAG: baseplate J/gp47 family protein [Spirochaetales bacterium]|nr:baseplate J/gp47 family protein [Spirochaetales bacterium]